MTSSADLSEPAKANLLGAQQPGEVAQREGWETNQWAVAMGRRIRDLANPLDAQRERLAALVACGGRVDEATSEALGQHFVILEALFQRFTSEAVRALERGGTKAPEHPEAFIRAAIKAQRASLACLSALKSLRSPTTPAIPQGDA